MLPNQYGSAIDLCDTLPLCMRLVPSRTFLRIDQTKNNGTPCKLDSQRQACRSSANDDDLRVVQFWHKNLRSSTEKQSRFYRAFGQSLQGVTFHIEHVINTLGVADQRLISKRDFGR
jgi:hypothetical protein